MQLPHSASHHPHDGKQHSKWTTVRRLAVTTAAENKLDQRTQPPPSKHNNPIPVPSTRDHSSLPTFPGFENLTPAPTAMSSNSIKQGPPVSADDAHYKQKAARVWSVSKRVGTPYADSAHRDWLKPDEELLKSLMDDN